MARLAKFFEGLKDRFISFIAGPLATDDITEGLSLRQRARRSTLLKQPSAGGFNLLRRAAQQCSNGFWKSIRIFVLVSTICLSLVIKNNYTQAMPRQLISMAQDLFPGAF